MPTPVVYLVFSWKMDKKLSIFLCSINLSLLLLYLKLKILTLPVYFGVAWLQQLLLCGGAFSRKQNLLHAFWGFFSGFVGGMLEEDVIRTY